jgi:hypothetical protein
MVAVSAERQPVDQEVILPEKLNGRLVDLLNPEEQYSIEDARQR